jgi:GNAT superfamily N-acetyltransferase/RimJ/RimL family protein N-acetyltransferase
MHFERFDPAADPARVRACYDMFQAGLPVDDPGGPPASLPVFTGWWALGWVNCPREAWLAAPEPGGPWTGCYLLELPDEENTHLGMLTVLVPPDQRRSGWGTALLRHAAQRAARAGRTVLESGTREGSPGAAFAVAAGARPGVTEVIRQQELASLPPGRLAELRRQATEAARGYSLVSWTGRCPEEYLDQMAHVVNAFADAPHNPGYEPEQYNARRLRLDEERSAMQRLRNYTVAARHDASGELAGMTAVGVDPEYPDWGFQELTAVSREHRGHKLGLLVKTAMLDLLAGAEPQLKRIHTGNADTNRHMVAINELLGYRVTSRWPGWQLDVARVLGDDTREPARAGQS